MSDPNRTPADDLPRDEALSALYRQLQGEEPRAAIDDAIRAAARREAGAGPQKRGNPWRWRVPLAAAATLLLTLVIVRQETVQEAVLQADVPRALPTAEPAPAMQEAVPVVAAESGDAGVSPVTGAEAVVPRREGIEVARERDAVAVEAEVARREVKQDQAVTAAPVVATAPAPAVVMAESVADAAADDVAAPASPPVATGSLAGSAVPAAKSAAPRALAKKEAAPDMGWARWPYGLALDEPADKACARVTRYRALSGCSARRDDDGSLVVALKAADAQALTDDLRNQMLSNGWRTVGPSTNGDGERYVQSMRGATAKVEWQPVGGGVIELRLFAAAE